MNQQGKDSILEQEINVVVAKINHFDDLRHRTMQLAVTLTIAAVGGAFAIRSPQLLVVAAAIPLPFWYIDARYHAYQEGFSLRWFAIEDYLNGRWASESFPIPDYYGSRTHPDHRTRTSLVRNLFRPRTLTTYFGLTLFVLLMGIYTLQLGFPGTDTTQALEPESSQFQSKVALSGCFERVRYV